MRNLLEITTNKSESVLCFLFFIFGNFRDSLIARDVLWALEGNLCYTYTTITCTLNPMSILDEPELLSTVFDETLYPTSAQRTNRYDVSNPWVVCFLR